MCIAKVYKFINPFSWNHTNWVSRFPFFGRVGVIAWHFGNSRLSMSISVGGVHQRWIFPIFFPKAAAKGSFKKSAVIKDCHQTSPKVLLKPWLSLKDCHQRLPKVLLKRWLSLKIVIKDCPKFCWRDGCLKRLSSKTAQSSAEEMAVLKRLSSKTAQSSAEEMAVLKR